MKRSLASITLALSLGAAACISDDPAAVDNVNLGPDDIILTSGLQTVGDCDALLARLIDEGLERVGPYGFGGGYDFFGPAVMEEAATDGAVLSGRTESTTPAGQTGGQDTDASGGESSGVSQTNTQEVGVDEADIVKTDGDRLIVATNGKVQVLDISGSVPRVVHTIKLAEWGGNSELFINGDQALLMSTLWSETPFAAGDLARSIRPAGTQVTRITTLDLVNGTLGSSIEFEGNYLSAREIDGSVRIVIAAGMGNFGWLYPSNPDTEDAATEANKNLLRKSEIGDWLPAYRVVDGDDVVDGGLLFDCDRTHLTSEFSGFGTIGVLTVDATDNFALRDSLGVVTDGQTVYASTDRLTVATPRYPEWDPQTGLPIDGETLRTALHNFDITDPNRAEYVASGAVPGTLLSQYSLSEHDGYLRVATTQQVGNDWNDTASSVAVLKEDGKQLVETGRVDGLGKGERIFAVRYQGDLAYVVTFRQTDPLYVIDLSDPDAPKARGELKIPGFSNYLHPLGDGLLLGIGQDATDEGRQTGAQASLFDVSDPDNPLRIDTLELGGEQSNSIVQWDPRAFTFWSDTNTGIIPVESWAWDEQSEGNKAGAVLVNIDKRSLVNAGEVNHKPVETCERYIDEEFIEPQPVDAEEAPADQATDAEAGFSRSAPVEQEYCWTHTPTVIRTVIANGTLYTISNEGVHTWDFDTLAAGWWIQFD